MAERKQHSSSGARIGILMGSRSDWPVMKAAREVCEDFGIATEVRIQSAHRTPESTASYAKSAASKGLEVLIAGAGGAAHLAGVLASHTTLPVIGVPVANGPLNGFDALLATVQMPPGIPVATVGIGGAANAALLAIQILAKADSELEQQLRQYRERMVEKVNDADGELQREL